MMSFDADDFLTGLFGKTVANPNDCKESHPCHPDREAHKIAAYLFDTGRLQNGISVYEVAEVITQLRGAAKAMAETILTKAAEATSGERRRDYGPPRPNHQAIASLWNAYRKIRRHPESDLDADDVARMMILLKIARDLFTPRQDNLVDIAGYARCLEEMRETPL